MEIQLKGDAAQPALVAEQQVRDLAAEAMMTRAARDSDFAQVLPEMLARIISCISKTKKAACQCQQAAWSLISG